MSRTLQRIDTAMRNQFHWLATLVAVAGLGACLAALLGFVATIATNQLSWYPGWTAQEHYEAIGRTYSQGFIVGFFLCFFLFMVSVSLANAIRWRRLEASRPMRSSTADRSDQAA